MAPFLDYSALRRFIETAVAHYERTAPALSDWLDELYRAIDATPATVTVLELFQLQQLHMDGEWEHPNHAQNRWYHVRETLGKDRGVISF